MKKIISLFILFTLIGTTACSSKNGDIGEGNKSKEKIKVAENDKGVKEEKEESQNYVPVEQVNLDKVVDQKILEKLSLMDLALLRNKIYARRGYDFSTKAYKEYFSEFDWYKPSGKDVEDKFTDVDNENMKRIKWNERKAITSLNSTETGDINPKYDGEVSVGYLGDSIRVISKKDEVGGFTNDNINLKLKSEKSLIDFNSGWNDGVNLNGIALYQEENKWQLIITIGGTDIGCSTVIYNYDYRDGTLSKHDEVSHLFKQGLYSHNGYLYMTQFEGNDKQIINSVYNYQTKEVQEIFDPELRRKLSFIMKEKRENYMAGKGYIEKDEQLYRFDIDYDSKEEEIWMKYTPDDGINTDNGFKMIIKDGEKTTEYSVDNLMSCDNRLRFIVMPDKMYMVVLDEGPSWDPVEQIYEYTGNEIIPVVQMLGELVDYSMEGKLFSCYDRINKVNLGYFDLYKKEYFIRPDMCEGKKIVSPYEISLFKEKFYTPDIHLYTPDEMKNQDSVEFVSKPFEELEIIELETGKDPEIAKRTHQYGTYNAPVKVRNKEGKEGWILWKDGGD